VYAQDIYSEVIELAEQHPDELIAALIEQHFGRHIDVVDQQVRAVLLSPEISKSLNAEAGSPGLNILRQYRDEEGAVMVVSETTHPQDRFTLVSQMRRERNLAT
jgi:DNA-binding GntR family transcriptional regulator